LPFWHFLFRNPQKNFFTNFILRTLKYPQCLYLLECLQHAEFREAIASTDNARYIEDQLLLQWHFYMRVRQRLQV